MGLMELKAGGWTATFNALGASLVRLTDPEGGDWITHPQPDRDFRGLFGSVAGPWTNRLVAARWGLAANQGTLHIHGGFRGADLREWNLRTKGQTLLAELEWPEGDEGYPSLRMEAVYRLRPGVISWKLVATAKKPVPLNPVQHGYWNLGAPTIDAHLLSINASGFWGPGPDGMTVPPLKPNPFSRPAPLQNTWDHTFFLDDAVRAGGLPAAILSFGARSMEVWTKAPTLHLYTGDYLPLPRTGVCLECGLPPGGPETGGNPPTRVEGGARHFLRVASKLQNCV